MEAELIADRFVPVSKEAFYVAIGQKDVVGQVRSSYQDENYGFEWKTRSGELVGYARNWGATPHWKPNCDYFIRRDLAGGAS